MSTETHAQPRVEKAAALGEDARGALRDLILNLADSKRVLGIRYSDWMLGAPTLEAGIAASSMAQDEWGHARLTYALLSDFGEEPRALEHDRPGEEYRNLEALDRPLASWSELIAAALLIDGALTVQYEALAESRYAPAYNRVQKLLDEERIHLAHAEAWALRLLESAAVREEFAEALGRFLAAALRWLGRDEDAPLRALREEGLVTMGAEEMRSAFLERVGRVLQEAEVEAREVEWGGWDPATRRASRGGLDPETLARVRGDKNRTFLLE
jgi:ring-1,2-phenylacetyl-CoA epoxidase subunit PaaC